MLPNALQLVQKLSKDFKTARKFPSASRAV